MAKPKAQDRTIDMFSGKTPLEELPVETPEDVQDTVRESGKTIEQFMDEKRDQAFAYQEQLSRKWQNNPDGEGYRLTEKDKWMLLETLRYGADGKTAYFWSGVMFDRDHLYELTNVFVEASKRRKNGEV